jgi:hypothetical protein
MWLLLETVQEKINILKRQVILRLYPRCHQRVKLHNTILFNKYQVGLKPIPVPF